GAVRRARVVRVQRRHRELQELDAPPDAERGRLRRRAGAAPSLGERRRKARPGARQPPREGDRALGAWPRRGRIVEAVVSDERPLPPSPPPVPQIPPPSAQTPRWAAGFGYVLMALAGFAGSTIGLVAVLNLDIGDIVTKE